MADFLIPVAGVNGTTHIFSQQELDASLTRMLGQLPPDREVGLGFAVDANGVGAGVMWHKVTDSGWQVAAAAAVTRDWSGDVGVGAHVMISK